MKKRWERRAAFLLAVLLLISALPVSASGLQERPQNTGAPEEAGREKLNFNQGWKFVRKNIQEAILTDYPTEELERWENVDLPHTVREEPYINSGGINYQGVAMYRKHFFLPESYHGKKMYIEFEGAMGVTDVWVNGQHLQGTMAEKTGENTQYGGYLPFVLDITEAVHCDGERNVITVLTDNSDDTDVPPGKPQGQLDFSYFGGIYRNVWMEVVSPVHITNSAHEDIVAGGGILVDYPEVSEDSATAAVSTHVRNEEERNRTVTLVSEIVDQGGEVVASKEDRQEIQGKDAYTFTQDLVVKQPKLWNINTPYMHTLISRVLINGVETDRMETPIGIRKITMSADSGISINGEHAGFLSGINRHQEYAYIGYAASSSLQRRDAIKYKSAGFNIVRTAHNPQSVDFLNACDELGILVVESVPGWQHWSSAPEFGERVRNDIRQMIRRDRNHPCILTYEISLNESPGVPADFTNACEKLAKEEHPSLKTSAENPHNGAVADILYGTPGEVAGWSNSAMSLIREYGDYWQEQNGNFTDNARVTRGPGTYYPGGEGCMVNQANNKLWNGYSFVGTGGISLSEGIENYNTSNHRFVGAIMWIGIDHNRGYHPTMSPCGIWDLRRIPKYSYYAFESQRPAEKDSYLESMDVKTGPMLFIASSWSEKAPVLDKMGDGKTLGTDAKRLIYVYSNASKVKLSVIGSDGNILWTKTNQPMNEKTSGNLDHPPFQFTDVPYTSGSYLRAEGYDSNEKLIAEQEIHTAGKPAKLKIEVDQSGADLTADGSDAAMAYAYVLDQDGNLCQDATNELKFSVEGPASIVGDGNKRVGANPVNAEAGIMGAFIRAGQEPGSITVRVEAEGLEAAETVITSKPLSQKCVEFEKIAQGPSIEYSSMYLSEKDGTSPGEDVPEFTKGTVTVQEKEYPNSLEVKNMQRVEYQLGGAYGRLTAKAALRSPSNVKEGSVFKVYCDGVLSYVSDPVTNGVIDIDVDISGTEVLTLCAEDVRGVNTSTVYWLSPYIYEGGTSADESELRENAAIFRTASATSSDAGTSSEAAIDGDINSLWRSAEKVTLQKPQVFTLDLEENVDLRNANLSVEQDYLECTYEIYTSCDGKNWDFKSKSSKTAHGNAQLDYFTASNVRYLMIRFTEVKSTQGEGDNRAPKASIKEFEAYLDKGVESTEEYNLKGLEVAGKEIAFQPDTTTYQIPLSGYESLFLIKALPCRSGAAVTVNGQSLPDSGKKAWEELEYSEVSLNEENQLIIEVTSPDGKGRKTYTITAKGESRQDTFDSADCFVPGKNGANGWFYQKMNMASGAITTLPDENAGYIAGEYAWNGGEGWIYSGLRYMHPSVNENALRTFVAPREGTIALRVKAGKNTGQAGEVGLSVRKNKEKIWPSDTEDFTVNESIGADFNLNLEVAQGDQIQIMLDPHGSNGGDATTVVSKVTYADPSDIMTGEINGREVLSHKNGEAAGEQYQVSWQTSNGSVITDVSSEWRLGEEAEGVRISQDGVLSVGESVQNKVVQIQAVYHGSVAAEKEIFIKSANSAYLSDLPWVSAVAGYGEVNKDKASSGSSIRLTGEDGKAVTYEKGLGTHAASKIVYDIKGKGYQAFQSYVGVDYSQNPDGFYANVEFKVYLNGDEGNPVYDSGAMMYDSVQKYVDIPLDESAETITLEVEEGENNWSDHANWADAKFLTEAESEIEQFFHAMSDMKRFYINNNGSYTKESWTEFENVYQEARDVLLKGEMQDSYSEVLSRLQDAYDGLEELIMETEVVLDQTIVPLEIGDSKLLTATVLPENASEKTVSWRSSDESIAAVSESGKVTGIQKGSATITALSQNGKTAKCKVIVKGMGSGIIEVSGISIAPAPAELIIGQEANLKAQIVPANASNQFVVWKSNHPEYASVDQNGKVKALKEGSVTITAVSCNGKEAVCRVTVKGSQKIEVERITINPSAAELLVGQQTVWNALLSPANATERTVTWRSDHPEIASVDQNGRITAMKEGNAVITAAAGNGVTAQGRITVKAKVPAEKPKVKLNYKSIILQKGKTTKVIKASGLIPGDRIKSWSSNKSSVAGVTKQGKITAKKAGTAAITVTTVKGAKASCKVKVTKKPVKTKSIKVNIKKLNLKKGKHYQLKMTRKPVTASDLVTYTSSNRKLAVVTAKGRITARKKGSCRITVKAASGKKAVVKLYIK